MESTPVLLKKDTLTESEILTLKRRLNNRAWCQCDIVGEEPTGVNAHPVDIEKEYNITEEQTLKGYDWLIDQWKTPRGVERKNNPFGYREQDILENFTRFTFGGFIDCGNVHRSYYQPVYTVHGEVGLDRDPRSFDYYVNGGMVEIIG